MPFDKQKDKEAFLTNGYVTIKEAAEFLALSGSKVYQMVYSGELEFQRFGRSVRIPKRALLKYSTKPEL